jgi:hypothetical protein
MLKSFLMPKVKPPCRYAAGGVEKDILTVFNRKKRDIRHKIKDIRVFCHVQNLTFSTPPNTVSFRKTSQQGEN